MEYRSLKIKSVNQARREIVGLASTNDTDLQGDIVLQSGVQFRLPMPFLYQHQHDQPIGLVTKVTRTPKGLEIVAKMPKDAKSKKLREKLEYCWDLITTRLARGLSVGFSGLEWSRHPETGGRIYSQWKLHEVSLCAIPANESAYILETRLFGRLPNGAVRILHKPKRPVVLLRR